MHMNIEFFEIKCYMGLTEIAFTHLRLAGIIQWTGYMANTFSNTLVYFTSGIKVAAELIAWCGSWSAGISYIRNKGNINFSSHISTLISIFLKPKKSVVRGKYGVDVLNETQTQNTDQVIIWDTIFLT